MPPPLEKEISKSCLNWLLKRKIFAWRNSSTGIFDREKGFFRTSPKRGAPDLIAIYQGKFIGIELKRPGNKLSEQQEWFRESVISAGGVYLVIHSVEELEKEWYNIK